MGGNPRDFLNEKTAQKKFIRNLELISRFLVFIGKPFFFILLLIISISLFFLNITGLTISQALKISRKFFTKNQLKQEGIIFISGKASTKPLKERLKKLYWKADVFLIASTKLSSKFISYLKDAIKSLEPLNRPKIFLLRIKLLRVIFYIPKLKILKTASLTILITAPLSIFLFWFFVIRGLPPPSELTERPLGISTKIYDRGGVLLYTIFKDQNRTPTKLAEIPLNARLATIAVEDAEFYSHPGFSIKGITRAILKNLRQKELTGGSTITQQLVKNALLTPEKTFLRKLREIVLSVQVELKFSKDQILEMYLNEVAYGGTAYGIEEAAQMYFSKDTANLSLAEAALLAGLTKSPTAYSPFGQTPEKAVERQKEVLRLMHENSFITYEQKESAEKEELKFSERKNDIKAPHFVFFVREYLEEKYGRDAIEKGGLSVVTSLDYQIQRLAEKVVLEEIDKLKKLHVSNAGVIVLNPKTGEILAMVGSRNYFDQEIDGNVNLTTRPRQPGSSIKIVNYAYALSNGYSLASVIPDTPVTFLVEGQPPYTPKNYEGGFRGNLTLRSAFAESRNIPAVRVLASYGVAGMIETGQKLGITTWKNTSDYGLSLTLGGGEVKLIDLTQVFATVANYGKKPNIAPILKITDYKGKVVEEFGCKDNCGEQILDPRVAFLITDILRDNTARSPSFGSDSLLVIPKHSEVAVKTGTSNDLRDNLAIGYNQKYVVAVWVGNNDSSEMDRIASGVTGATPIFNKIMSALLANEENHNWEVPNRLVQLPICPLTGTLACEGCPARMEWFLEENKPQKVCSSEWFKKEEESSKDENGQILTPAWESELIDLQNLGSLYFKNDP